MCVLLTQPSTDQCDSQAMGPRAGQAQGGGKDRRVRTDGGVHVVAIVDQPLGEAWIRISKNDVEGRANSDEISRRLIVGRKDAAAQVREKVSLWQAADGSVK